MNNLHPPPQGGSNVPGLPWNSADAIHWDTSLTQELEALDVDIAFAEQSKGFEQGSYRVPQPTQEMNILNMFGNRKHFI
jgi:hypothetical protein